MENLQRPLLIYDGDCNFCRHFVVRWHGITSGAITYVPYQEVMDRFSQISRERFENSIQLVLPSGEILEGAEAVFTALARASGWGWGLWIYRNIPGFAPVSEWGYSLVARNRMAFSRLTRLWWGNDFRPETYSLTRRLFLSGMGLVYLLAFASLYVQITGLVGEKGLSPASEYLDLVRRHTEGLRYFDFPTVFWIDSSDASLKLVCALGAVLGLLGLLRVMPVVVFSLLWILYQSVVTVGGDFLRFQWDVLLLEAGLLTILFCPFRLLKKKGPEPMPSRIVLWLLRWLLFRLMWFSGVVKLSSGDPIWRSLKALSFHFETQPLPNWVGWWAHQLPESLQQTSVFLMFVIELLLPFFIFGPRRFRPWLFGVFALFQVMIMVTGNYGFFNLLSLVLCLVLLEDEVLKRWLPSFRTGKSPEGQPQGEPWFKLPLLAGTVVMVLTLSSVFFMRLVDRNLEIWEPVRWVARLAAPIRAVNSYGLFAVMTVDRPEIILEGSTDGRLWKPYEFSWKPGSVTRSPEFVAPHQPRLDWQMWFAALGNYRQNPWVIRLMVRLLEGAPPVVGLLEYNPFPDAPPKYMRALVYEYRFSDSESRAASKVWWQRVYKGRYAPYVKLPETEWPEGGFVSPEAPGGEGERA